MARLPATISPIRWAGTPISLASRYCESPIGRRNSSSSSSPGVTGLSFAMASAPSVVVHDLNVFGAAGRPAEAHPKLVVLFQTPCDLQLPRRGLGLRSAKEDSAKDAIESPDRGPHRPLDLRLPRRHPPVPGSRSRAAGPR